MLFLGWHFSEGHEASLGLKQGIVAESSVAGFTGPQGSLNRPVEGRQYFTPPGDGQDTTEPRHRGGLAQTQGFEIREKFGPVGCISRPGTGVAGGTHPGSSPEGIDFNPRIISKDKGTRQGDAGGKGLEDGILLKSEPGLLGLGQAGMVPQILKSSEMCLQQKPDLASLVGIAGGYQKGGVFCREHAGKGGSKVAEERFLLYLIRSPAQVFPVLQGTTPQPDPSVPPSRPHVHATQTLPF